MRIVSRAVAVVALAAAGYFTLVAPDEKVCSDETVVVTPAQGGEAKTVTTTCSAQGTTLNDVLPLVGIAGLALLGEFSELSIPGLVALKRQVINQEEEIGRQENRQENLERQILSLQQISLDSRTVVNNNLGEAVYQNPRRINEEIEEKTAKTLDGDQAQPADGHHADADAPSPELTALQLSVLEAYEQISPYVQIGLAQAPEVTLNRNPRVRPTLNELSMFDIEQLHAWARIFKREIESVRSVRNAIAHPPALVSREDLEATLSTIEALQAELTKVLDRKY